MKHWQSIEQALTDQAAQELLLVKTTEYEKQSCDAFTPGWEKPYTICHSEERESSEIKSLWNCI
jgi:hypothetical protein